MNYYCPIFGLEIVRASPQLDLVVQNNRHSINFLWVDINTWRDTHFFVGSWIPDHLQFNTHFIFAKLEAALDIVEGLHHEIIENAQIGILRNS